jgi:hypothetical protein
VSVAVPGTRDFDHGTRAFWEGGERGGWPLLLANAVPGAEWVAVLVWLAFFFLFFHVSMMLLVCWLTNF